MHRLTNALANLSALKNDFDYHLLISPDRPHQVFPTLEVATTSRHLFNTCW
jgi:hypothetical protein